MATLPEVGFLRLKDIIGDSKAEPPTPAIVPISRSAWLAGCKEGRFPRPIKLSPKTTVWKIKDIQKWIDGQ